VRMSSEKVKRALKVVDIPEIRVLAEADIGWDVIESIEYLGEMPTVAVTVPGPETYIVDLIEHNTATEVFTILWFLFTRPNARGPCPAPGRPQLEDVLWPEFAKWLEQSKIAPYFRWPKTKVFFVGFEETWFATMRTAAKPENMQGFHGDHMLWILDEASGLEEEITEPIEGSLTGGKDNKIGMGGTRTKLSGWFSGACQKE